MKSHITKKGEPVKVTNPSLIRRRREREKFTQTDLARLTGVSQQFISLLETGTNRYCSQRLAEKICARLDIDLEDAFEELKSPSVAEYTSSRRVASRLLAA